MLPPRLAALPSRIARHTDAEGHSPTLEPWRAWYKTPEWSRLRRQTFVRDLFICQMVECGELISDARQRVCDHKRPHRGDRTLFFDPDNLQTLCKPCHDRIKQRIERREIRSR